MPSTAVSVEAPTLRIETPRAFSPLLTPARYKGAHGGRGSAKSWSFAASVLEWAVMCPGSRIVCIREVQLSLAQSVKRLLEDLIQRFDLGALFNILTTHIETPGGGIVIFQGMQNHTAESIKSLEGYDVAWVEEAQSLSQRSLDLLRPTIRKAGSEIWFTWNPRHASDPIDRFLRGPDGPPPGTVLVDVSYRDNPWLPQELRDEIAWDQRRDPEKFAHVWLGGYERHSEARVFRNWTVEEFETLPDAAFLFGADWGFAVDPTVLVRGFVRERKLFIDASVYRVGCEVDDTPVLFDSLGDGMARRWPIVADSARPETISYMQRHGYPRIVGARKGPGSVEEGVSFLKSYDIVVHPRCHPSVVDELTFYSYKTHPLTGAIMPVLDDRKNHVIDSLRYMLEPLNVPVADVSLTW